MNKPEQLMSTIESLIASTKKVANTLRRVFISYKPSPEEIEFLIENQKHWQTGSRKTNNKPVVLVETALASPASLFEKFLIAKTIEQKTGASVIAILNAIFNKTSPAYLVAKSFGIVNFYCFWRGYTNPKILIRSVYEATRVILERRSGTELLKLEIQGIYIGDLVYDTLIRYKPNCYTVDKLKFISHFRLILRAHYNFHNTKRLFTKNNVTAIVTSHNVYAEFGIPCRLANHFGATIFLKDMDVYRVYKKDSNVREHFLKISTDELESALTNPNIIEEAEIYFQKRMSGQIDQIDLKNAYERKKIYTKKEFLEKYKADQHKKNVFVMAHAFSDAPHVGGTLAFQDYYDWLKETLQQLSLNQNVNTFVKPHPSSYMWGEKGAVESLLDTLEIRNIYITPSDLSNESIKNITDYIVTARGTAGLEYSGYGIPAIVCAEGYYSGFEIAIEAYKKTEYIQKLGEIEKTNQLTKETCNRARVLLYLTFSKLARSSNSPKKYMKPGDDIKETTRRHFKEIELNLKKIGIARDQLILKTNEKLQIQIK